MIGNPLKQPVRVLLFALAATFALALFGCKGKSEAPQTLEHGLEQLRSALANASPDVQSNLYNGIRYENYVGALMSLDQIAASPTLTEPQKKCVNTVIDLLKARIEQQKSAPQTGH